MSDQAKLELYNVILGMSQDIQSTLEHVVNKSNRSSEEKQSTLKEVKDLTASISQGFSHLIDDSPLLNKEP